jgi:hypothetical protein
MYLAILLLTIIKKQTNLATLKSIYAETMSQVMGNDSYRQAASENFLQAFEDMVDVVVAYIDPTEPNAMRDARMDQLLADCPTNIKEPNFSRWGTVSHVAKVVMKHWIPLFYLAQNVKDSNKNNSYIHTVATRLIELMSSQADPDQEMLTHCTSLKFIVAFEDYMFDGNMEWAKKNDPVFGARSYLSSSERRNRDGAPLHE